MCKDKEYVITKERTRTIWFTYVIRFKKMSCYSLSSIRVQRGRLIRWRIIEFHKNLIEFGLGLMNVNVVTWINTSIS